MRNQIRNLNQGINNTEDGIALIKTAEQALQESQNILKRMHELAVQAANDVNSIEDRQAIQNEIDSLYGEIDDIANKTQFNGRFPLNGTTGINQYSTNGISNNIQTDIQNIPVSTIVAKKASISDDSYLSGSVTNITLSNLNTYSSYSDSDGRIHYMLGEGKYNILSDVKNVVLDISGNSAIENSSLNNVSVLCSEGTNLSIKNTSINNFNIDNDGVGAAIEFQGSGNVLNCYGTNNFYGGFNDYKVYSDSYESVPYNAGCAAINVGGGDSLIINGTDSSVLKVHGCDDARYTSYGYEASRCSSWAIGSNYHEDGGNITINGGHIIAYATNEEREGMGEGCIGGGKNISITINGGIIDSYGGAGGSIGGGDTVGDGRGQHNSNGNIIINDGVINATSSNAYAAIGFEQGGNITINGGEIHASSKTGPTQSVGIGGGYSHTIPNINITGGYVYAQTKGNKGAAIGSSEIYSGYENQAGNGVINISGGTVIAISTDKTQAIGKGVVHDSSYPDITLKVDNIVTDGTGIDDNNGHHIFIYSSVQSSSDSEEDNNDTSDSANNSGNYGDLWIQSGANAGEGMFISTVDATTSGIGLSNVDVLSHQSASNSMGMIDNALKKVSEYRSQFGAQQNRLEYTIEHELNYSENLQNAESNLRDTDMAKEMLEYSKNSILEQAAQSMISQANQQNQGMLQLLQ